MISSVRFVGTGTKPGLIDRFFSLQLSQKINYAFAFFFFVGIFQDIFDYGGFTDVFQLTGALAVVVFVVLAQFDNVAIRFMQFLLLLLLSFFLVLTNDDPSQLSAFILLSVSLAAAYKMALFGRKTLTILGITVGLTLVFAYAAGVSHGFSVWQRINVINFVLVYLGLLFFIFEEETLSLRRQRDILTRRAESIQPFAELGTNVAGLVHDMKNDIAGLSALASVERLSDNHDTAATLQRYAERLDDRIESILYVATAGDHHELEPISLGEVLRRVVYYFVEVNRDLKHAVHLDLYVPEEVVVETRRNALLSILENVITNSIEATEGFADRTITVRAVPSREGAVITIEHRGRHLPWKEAVGTPIDVRSSQFFRRGRSARKDGTGLGMINVIRALEVIDSRMTMENLATGVRSTVFLKSAGTGRAIPDERSVTEPATDGV